MRCTAESRHSRSRAPAPPAPAPYRRGDRGTARGLTAVLDHAAPPASAVWMSLAQSTGQASSSWRGVPSSYDRRGGHRGERWSRRSPAAPPLRAGLPLGIPVASTEGSMPVPHELTARVLARVEKMDHGWCETVGGGTMLP